MRNGESNTAVTIVPLKGFGNLDGKWYVKELSPLPLLKKDREEVIKAIYYDKSFRIDDNFTVWKHENDSMNEDLPKKLKKVISKLKSLTFTVAVRGLSYNLITGKYHYSGLPIAIILNEDINLEKFPFHPHLYPGKYNEFPTSLCYSDNLEVLGRTSEERVVSTLEQVSIWLIKHMIFELYYETYHEIYWIGLETKHPSEKIYVQSLNPNGKCRCGKNQLYRNCCLKNHLKELGWNHSVQLLKNLQGNWSSLRLFEKKLEEELNNSLNMNT